MGRCVLPYVASQLVGAFAASGVMRLLFVHPNLGGTYPAGSVGQSFTMEFILTAILMSVILSVSSGPKEKGIMAGIAIGGVIGLEAMFAGPVCGASMNSARSIAPALISGDLRALWVYALAPTLGAIGVAPWHRWLCTPSTGTA